MVNRGYAYDQCINIDERELADAPLKTNDPNNPDASNGLITSIWGPPTWESFHSITFGYPIAPTQEQKIHYLTYFTMLGNVLPCSFCRISYQQFISCEPTRLNMDTMRSRETLTRWGYEMHNAVNKKLDVRYGDTYEEMCYKYESFRASCDKKANSKGCLMPLDIKAKSYQKASIHRTPIVESSLCMALTGHAQKFGFKNYAKNVTYYANLKRNTKEWGGRDCTTRKIITYMRKNGIRAIDDDGMPGYYEMILLSFLCTTLEISRLAKICQNI